VNLVVSRRPPFAGRKLPLDSDWYAQAYEGSVRP
jgi:hypothetical protein